MADISIPCANTSARFYYNLTARGVSACSMVCNLFVLIACQHQQKRMKIYGRMMALAAGFNAFYSFSAMFIGMRSLLQGTLFFYFTDSPFLLYASPLAQQLSLHLTFTIFYIHAGLPSIQFFIRYKVIKDSHADLSILYASFFGLVLFCAAYSSSYAIDFEEPSEGYRKLLYSKVDGCDLNKVLPTYSVVDKTTLSSQIHKVLVVVILSASSVVVVYFGLLTWLHFKRHLVETSYQTKKFNRDINLVLTFQALLPFTFIVLPNSLFLANAVPVSITSTVGVIANFGSLMSPLLDALIVLFIIPAFRKNVLKSLSGTTPRSSNTLFVAQ